MDTDLILTIGLLFAVLAVPAVLGAFAESRAPRLAALLVLVATSMITTAVLKRPGGYEIREIPNAVISVIARVL